MNDKYVLANLALWLIAIVTTLLVTADTGRFTILGPVLAVCMIGSVVTVKRAARR